MRRPLARALASLLALFALITGAACGPPDDPGAAPAPAPTGDAIYVEDARAVSSPGGGTGVVYLTLANPTAADDVLRSVSTPAAKVAEVHETIHSEGGMVRMEAFPEGLSVPAGERVELAPGGKHLMLLALNGPMAVGEEIELTLVFDGAGEMSVRAPVWASVVSPE